MNARAEVARLKQRIDATFKRIEGLDSDLELRSDFARYLCVLVSGYLETSIAELVLEHARRSSTPTLHRFVEVKTPRFTNANSQRLQNLLGSFDLDWRQTLESSLVDERNNAVDSVVDLRNTIAHGGFVGVTYQRISEYYRRAHEVFERIADLCAPE